MIALFYRAWADAHPAVQVERAVGGRVRAMLEAMAGIGLPGTHNANPDLDAVKLRQAASLASQVDGPERLTLFLAEAFKVPVQLKEFVATWMTVPTTLCRAGWAKSYARAWPQRHDRTAHLQPAKQDRASHRPARL